MKFAVLGTGMVGRAIASKLVSIGHEVTLGTRDPAATGGRTEAGPYGAPSFADWRAGHPAVKLATFADAVAGAEIVVNASSGQASLDILASAGSHLDGKVVMDIANPLDFSQGFPPSLSVCNTDSLGEQLQRAFPKARIVKTLNTVTADLMVNPKALAGGEHTMFVCGEDEAAKATVTSILREGFGWTDVIDLGGIAQARGTEQLLPIWVRLYGKLQTPMFSFKVVR